MKHTIQAWIQTLFRLWASLFGMISALLLLGWITGAVNVTWAVNW